jgi:hypothetical protein
MQSDEKPKLKRLLILILVASLEAYGRLPGRGVPSAYSAIRIPKSVFASYSGASPSDPPPFPFDLHPPS